MGLGEQYFLSFLAAGLAFLLSLVVFFRTRTRCLGCILQFLSFIGLLLIFSFFLVMYNISEESTGQTGAMISVRSVEETRDCRYERTWWMKPDNTYYLLFDKGSNSHKVEPCGNDRCGDYGKFSSIDSIHAIKMDYNPSFVIYFDLDSQKVTPMWDKDTLEVVDIDWEKIKKYFKSINQN